MNEYVHPSFSIESKNKLLSCDPRLIMLFNNVAKKHECKILCGHRNKKDQQDAFFNKKTKLQYPKSKHNKFPSLAVDVIAFPSDWNDFNKHYYFSGIVLGIAYSMGIDITWGGDWDRDNNLKENKFNDLVHFEIKE